MECHFIIWLTTSGLALEHQKKHMKFICFNEGSFDTFVDLKDPNGLMLVKSFSKGLESKLPYTDNFQEVKMIYG